MKLYADTSWWLACKFHVAVAIECAADAVFTFDKEQGELVEAAGLTWLHLPARKP